MNDRHYTISGDYDSLCFLSKTEADEILNDMHDLINNYGYVSVADLLDLVGATSSYFDSKRGWSDLDGMHTYFDNYSGRWKITFPKPSSEDYSKSVFRKYIDNLCFNAPRDAEDVLVALRCSVDKYGYATVSDLYHLMGTPMVYGFAMDKMYGWSNLDASYAYMHSDGRWKIYLPEPYFVEEKNEIVDEKNPANDPVNHPTHYQSETGLEVIDVIEAFTFDLKGIEATDTGNVLKYMCRWKNKNGLQDLKKANWYLSHLINHVEKLEEENECH